MVLTVGLICAQSHSIDTGYRPITDVEFHNVAQAVRRGFLQDGGKADVVRGVIFLRRKVQLLHAHI